MSEHMMTKVCAYVMTVDSGLAPNPFHGICTLAVCTPNHMRANLSLGDWIVGVAGRDLRSKLGHSDQWRLVYAMKISDRRGLNSYYNDPIYKAKIPKLVGSRIEMCGDNFYKLTPEGLKHTHETHDHVDNEKQDTEGDRVFIGKEFYYFGSRAIELPHNKSWSKLIVRKFQHCAVGLRYLLGGFSRDQWNKNDFQDFQDFLYKSRLKVIPEPAHFPHRDKSELENASCPKCT